MAKKGTHLSPHTKQLLSRLMKGRKMKQSTKIKIKRAIAAGHSLNPHRQIHMGPRPHKPYKRTKPYSRYI